MNAKILVAVFAVSVLLASCAKETEQSSPPLSFAIAESGSVALVQ